VVLPREQHEANVMRMNVSSMLAIAALVLAALSGCASESSPSKASAATKSKASTSKAPASSGAAGRGAAGLDSAAIARAMEPSPDPRGACDIHSGFPGDDACILPPDPAEGMQLHIGPSSYDDPAEIAKFTFHPAQESSECFTFHTPNDADVYYQTFVMSGRPGTHHIINTMYSTKLTDGGFTMCLDGGTGNNSSIIDNLPGASKAYMPRGTVAPENVHVGRAIPAHAAAQADMHYFNYTDSDILREFWMNIYFVPKEQITQPGIQIRGMGGLSWNWTPIAPGTDKTYSYSCPITGDGRILNLLGHYHSHGKRFTGSVQRAAGDVTKVFEMYDYNDPATFQYDTITTNPDFTDAAAGATSGMLDVHAGDTLLWDCHVINDSMTALTYVNNVKSGEMCNIWGVSIGPKINCVRQ
jgi:hypothetical protein